jgi:hypothetical protein
MLYVIWGMWEARVDMTSRPNILLTTCDQLRACATGCYGNGNVRTPHIDARAAHHEAGRIMPTPNYGLAGRG